MNENNTHPLTVTRAAEMWDKCSKAMGGPFAARLDDMFQGDRDATLAAMCTAYDAGSAEWKANAEAAAVRAERAEEKLAGSVHVDKDDRPWEPLGQDDPLHAGDEVRRDGNGITSTAVVGSLSKDGHPWTTEKGLIGLRHHGTWYVRRPAPTLPTEKGAVIIPAEGHEFIETNCGMYQFVMILNADGRWRGGAEVVASEDIVPGTWRAA